MNRRVYIIIKGEVTGVGFRFKSIELARNLDIKGWVRNTERNEVEILAEGEKEKLENLITWAKKGPIGAVVTEVEVSWEPATGEFQEFNVKY